MKSDVEAESIPDGYYANLQNINSSSVGSISADKGYTTHGNTAQSGNKVISAPAESYKLRDGTKVKQKVIDDGSNCIILWLNPQNTTNHEDGEWEILLSGLTKEKEVWFASFNTTTVNRQYITNGVENLSFWNGATTYITVALAGGEGTITVNDTTNFSASGSVIIGGSTVTYTGKSATTLTGCSGTPAAAVNDGVAEAVDTSTLSAAPKLTNMSTIGGRLMGSITTRIYGSGVGDGTSWTVPSPVTLSSPFVRDFPEGDGDISSVGAVRDYTIIGKPGRTLSYKITFTADGVAPQEIIEELDGDYGPASDNFVKLDDNTLSYVTEDGQIRLIQMNQQNERLTARELNADVRPTMKNGVYSGTPGCKGIYWRKERMLIYTFKKNSSSSANDTQVKIEFVTDKESGQTARPNIGFKNWTVNCFSKDGTDLFFHGSFEKNSFHAFDGYTYADAPWTAIATTKRYSMIDGLQEAKVLYLPVQGFIGPGQVLKFELDYDHAGTRAHLEAEFDSATETDYLVEPVFKTIGALEIGNEPIGGNLDDIDELNFFRIFFTLPEAHNPYDIQFTVTSDGVNTDRDTIGNRWQVNLFGFDRRDARTQVDKRLKKHFS
jgi:hypothetical protein